LTVVAAYPPLSADEAAALRTQVLPFVPGATDKVPTSYAEADVESTLLAPLPTAGDPDWCHFFVTGTGSATLTYGCVMANVECAEDVPSFAIEPRLRTARHEGTLVTRWYCLISAVPAFEAHFDILHSLVASERLWHFERRACGERSPAQEILRLQSLTGSTDDDELHQLGMVAVDEQLVYSVSDVHEGEEGGGGGGAVRGSVYVLAPPVDGPVGDETECALLTSISFDPFTTVESVARQVRRKPDEHLFVRNLEETWMRLDGACTLTSLGVPDGVELFLMTHERAQLFDRARRMEHAVRDGDSPSLCLLKEYLATSLPSTGTNLTVRLGGGTDVRSYEAAGGLDDDRLLGSCSLAIALDIVPLPILLQCRAAAMAETSVIFIAPSAGVASAVASSLVILLRPLVWQSVFVPYLPEHMYDFLHSPVPLIAGLVGRPDDADDLLQDMLVVDLTTGVVQEPEGGVLAVPGTKKLAAALKPYAAMADGASAAEIVAAASSTSAVPRCVSKEMSVLMSHFGAFRADLVAAIQQSGVLEPAVPSDGTSSSEEPIERVRSPTSDLTSPAGVRAIVAEAPKQSRPFYEAFFSTQVFASFAPRLAKYMSLTVPGSGSTGSRGKLRRQSSLRMVSPATPRRRDSISATLRSALTPKLSRRQSVPGLPSEERKESR
jgi:hypothetical protein